MMEMVGKKAIKMTGQKKFEGRYAQDARWHNDEELCYEEVYEEDGEKEVMENYTEDITKYPTPDKQYEAAMKYCTYESIQTGAQGKPAK
jgi:hypothetical protein